MLVKGKICCTLQIEACVTNELYCRLVFFIHTLLELPLLQLLVPRVYCALVSLLFFPLFFHQSYL